MVIAALAEDPGEDGYAYDDYELPDDDDDDEDEE